MSILGKFQFVTVACQVRVSSECHKAVKEKTFVTGQERPEEFTPPNWQIIKDNEGDLRFCCPKCFVEIIEALVLEEQEKEKENKKRVRRKRKKEEQ